MQRYRALLLILGSILLLADIGVESREGLDTRDIAVSDKIVAAKEVKRLFPCQQNCKLCIVFMSR